MVDAAPSIISDGSVDFLGGQDASKIPDRVPPNAYYAGVNISTQKGALRPRWPFIKQEFTFTDQRFTMRNLQTRPYKDIFLSGKFQACIAYSIGREFYFLVIISGIIFLINKRTKFITVIPISDGSRINELTDRVNCEPAGRYVVIHDYPAFPVIVENFTARRADPAKYEVPISTLGSYNQNRLFIANAGNSFTAGDPSGNVATPNAPITFEEIMVPSSPYVGQIFELSTNFNNDPITAMGFLSQVDGSTSIGPLLVATQNALWAYNSQTPRNLWQNGVFGTSLTDNIGIAGPRAMSNVSSDIFFISPDGQARTLNVSRQDQGRWSKLPISREVENWLKYYDVSLVKYAAISYFKNKIFFTANPYRTTALTTNKFPTIDYTNGGLVVLETDNIATLSQGGAPTWAGLWTGIRPMDMVLCDKEFYIIAKDFGTENAIYQVEPDTLTDRVNKRKRQIRSIVYTREYDFQNPFQIKEAHSIDFNIQDIKGSFSLDVDFKPSHGAYFVDWRTFTHIAPWQACGATVPGAVLNGFSAQAIRDINLGSPVAAGECDEVQKTQYGYFKKIQLKLTIEGAYWEIHELKVNAIVRPQYQNISDPTCKKYPTVALGAQCTNDWSIPQEDICQVKT